MRSYWKANRTKNHRLGKYQGSSVNWKDKISVRKHAKGFEVKPFGESPFMIEQKLLNRLKRLNSKQREFISKQVNRKRLLEEL